MATTAGEFTIELASVADRDELVAEIWLGREMLAELRHEPEGVRIEIYASSEGKWETTYDALVDALQRGKSRLAGASHLVSQD